MSLQQLLLAEFVAIEPSTSMPLMASASLAVSGVASIPSLYAESSLAVSGVASIPALVASASLAVSGVATAFTQ